MECEKCKKETDEIWKIKINGTDCEYNFCPKCAEKYLVAHDRFWHDSNYERLTILKML